MKKIVLVFGILIFWHNTVSAQEKFDIAGISFIHNPKVGLLDPENSNLENLDLNVTELNAFVMIPTKLKNEKTILFNGLKWHFVRTPFEDFPNNISFEANLHSFQYTFGINQNFSEKWGLLVHLKPTLASNFKGGISSDDFFFQGHAIVHKTVTESIKYGVGISYMNGFGEPKTVPVLMFNHKTDKLRLQIIAPIKLNFKYERGKVIYGFDIELEGGQFHLSSEVGDGPIINNLAKVKFSRFNIGPTLGWNVNKSSRIEISGGIAVKRTLKTIDNNALETDYDLKNGIFLKTGFYFGK